LTFEDINQISVIGAGTMGHGIAQCFAMAGYPVVLYDVGDEVLATAQTRIEASLELFRDAGLIEPNDIASALERISTTTSLADATQGSDFIVEAAPEDLALKQSLFRDIESSARADAILASNTSSLTMADMGTQVAREDRLVITHWFNPPQIVPVVEVVKGPETTDETVDVSIALLNKARKTPIRIEQELPGLIVNRVQKAIIREVFDLVEQGVAGVEEIDRAIQGSIGFRLASIGPLRTCDMGGLDIWLRVYNNLIPHIQNSTDPPAVLEDLVAQGHLGAKSGKGFYDYTADLASGELDEVVRKRDREFLARLKSLYWDQTQVKKA
jgi:3-hydroxybutyryl-CoA dehydrogenase